MANANLRKSSRSRVGGTIEAWRHHARTAGRTWRSSPNWSRQASRVSPPASWNAGARRHCSALEALIDDLPPHTHQYLGPTGTEALKAATDQDRDEAIKLMAEWLRDHPEHAAVLNEATGEPDPGQHWRSMRVGDARRSAPAHSVFLSPERTRCRARSHWPESAPLEGETDCMSSISRRPRRKTAAQRPARDSDPS